MLQAGNNHGKTVLDGGLPSPSKIIFNNVALHRYLPDLFWDFTTPQAVCFSASLFIISVAQKARSVQITARKGQIRHEEKLS